MEDLSNDLAQESAKPCKMAEEQNGNEKNMLKIHFLKDLQ